MEQQKKWLISGIAILLMLLFVGGLGHACGTGWLQIRVGSVDICGVPPLPPPLPCSENPKECIRAVAKLVSIEIDKAVNQEHVIQPDLPFGLKQMASFFGVEDKFLVQIFGTVTAGFNLENLNKDDIWIDGITIVIQLPAPEIMFTTVNKTEILYHDDDCPIVCVDSVEATDEILNKAKDEMVNQAVSQDKILDLAADSARKYYTQFFKMMGYEDITIYIDHHPL